MDFRARGFFAVVLCAVFAINVHGQNTTGTIVGSVTDPSGAVISGASITTSNQSTGLSRSVVSNMGEYRIPLLPPGTYSVRIETKGFRTEVRNDVVLDLLATVRVDVTLQIGDAQQIVDVTAQAPLLEADSSAVGQVIENKTVTQLPLNVRQYLNLTFLAPFTVAATRDYATSDTPRDIVVPSVGGQRAENNSYLIDGFDNRIGGPGEPAVTPPIDAIAEFKVQTGTAPAEYGRTTSTAITVSTQGGSNQIHGSAYEFLRNDLFDATPYFGHTKDSLKRNQFGATLGGPIVRNRLFLFGNYEGFQQRAGGPPVVGLVPTTDQRNGIFDHTVVDPDTCTDFSDKTTCTPFANNIIPADRISPISLALLNYWPEPNVTGDPTRNFIFQPPSSPTQRHYGLIRSDYNPRPSDSFFVRFLRNDESVSTPPQFPNGVKGTSFGLTAWTAGGHYTHIFNPQLINDFGFGGSTIAWSTLSLLANQADIATKVGIENTAGVNDPRFSGTPAVSIPGLLSLGDQSPLARHGHLYQAMDAITWQRGKHSLKFGGDWRRNYVNEFYTGQNDSNSFSNNYTLDNFADFLLGIPSSVNKTARAKAYGGTVDAFSGFIQDDWRIAPRLTLNVGVRYDIETALSSPTHDFLRWNQQTGEMILSDQVAGKAEIADFYANVRPDIKIRFVSDATPYDVNKLNFAPRLGFAYQALSKVVIRGGFGMFYGSPSVSWLESANDFAPNSLRPSWTGNSTSPVFVLPNGNVIPSGYNPEGSGGLEATVAYPAPLTIFPIYSRYLPYPTNLQWSLGIQTQLTPTLVVETQYLGSHAYHNNGYTNTNVVATPDPAPIQPRLPFPSFARIQGVVFGEDAWFEGLSIKAEKRAGKGLSFLASYTWSKSLDTGSTIEAKGLWTDPLNQRRTAKGLSYFDVPQHLVVSAQYDLPFGRGHALASAAGPVLNHIIGGWNVRGIGNFQSGFPFDPSMSLARTNICATACTVRPDVVHNPNLPGNEGIKNGLSSTPGIGYWDASAFVLPSLSAPRIGNAGRGLLRGPGINNFDLGVFKQFVITERLRMEFGYEAFNAFNHPQFLAPSTNLENLATFGKLTGANPPRISQFVLKIRF